MKQVRQWLHRAQGELQHTQEELNSKETECRALNERLEDQQYKEATLNVRMIPRFAVESNSLCFLSWLQRELQTHLINFSLGTFIGSIANQWELEKKISSSMDFPISF